MTMGVSLSLAQETLRRADVIFGNSSLIELALMQVLLWHVYVEELK